MMSRRTTGTPQNGNEKPTKRHHNAARVFAPLEEVINGEQRPADDKQGSGEDPNLRELDLNVLESQKQRAHELHGT